MREGRGARRRTGRVGTRKKVAAGAPKEGGRQARLGPEEFKACLFHELRNPVHNLVGLVAALMDRRGAKLDGRAWYLLERIHENTLALGRILQGLARLTPGRGSDHRETERTRPAEVMAQIVDQHGAWLRSARARIEVLPDLPAARMPFECLYLLLDNLVVNGIKAQAGAGRPWVRLGSRKEGARVVYFLEDGGPGIPRSKRAKVFEPFVRFDVSSPGSGMGLTLAKMLIEARGGRIWIEDAEEGGARFCFALS